ncbi:PREDICTED: F-box/kelch-repeat protein At2g22050-like [Brassica oleracea var. oleracea]|nr:PREDICTED: F-box/kelch-repeat protein At2g22050-like [Brassica oleracea var. oleracea]
MSVTAASNSKKSRAPSLSFSSLPDEVVLKCLFRVPRCYDLNLSLVSKTLRSLVRSPELYRLRSQLKSVYLSYDLYQRGRLGRSLSYWITFRPGEKTTDYQLADVLPRPSLGSAVSVGSEIYFIGGRSVPSTELCILDTRSGHLRTAPSMKVCRSDVKVAVGLVDRKIYVIGGSKEDSQVEEFDPETQTWGFAGEEKLKCESWFSATLEEKVYMVNWDGRVSTYSPREGVNNEATEILSVGDNVKFLCVVENVLYACFKWGGLMWFNTKLKVWRRVVDRDGKDGKLELYSFAAVKMVEYEGTIAFFWPLRNIDPNKKDLTCKLIALDRVGEEISGRIEWSGIVATLPHNIRLKDCLVVSG